MSGVVDETMTDVAAATAAVPEIFEEEDSRPIAADRITIVWFCLGGETPTGYRRYKKKEKKSHVLTVMIIIASRRYRDSSIIPVRRRRSHTGKFPTICHYEEVCITSQLFEAFMMFQFFADDDFLQSWRRVLRIHDTSPIGNKDESTHPDIRYEFLISLMLMFGCVFGACKLMMSLSRRLDERVRSSTKGSRWSHGSLRRSDREIHHRERRVQCAEDTIDVFFRPWHHLLNKEQKRSSL